MKMSFDENGPSGKKLSCNPDAMEQAGSDQRYSENIK
jgi:hypothetical protein